MQPKKIAFLTGTRADYGKLKSLIEALNPIFEPVIIATGMHLLESYGRTIKQVLNDNLAKVETFENQVEDSAMHEVLANSICGLSKVLTKIKADLLVVHGDRVEAMAGALTGALMNIRVAHIEGGEKSGTVDNLLRHSISKLAQHHFVSNARAMDTLLKLGESKSQIYEIGSPDIDIIEYGSLPNIREVKNHYQIDFENYAILLFHPITTEISTLELQTNEICKAVVSSELKWVIIQPNNDSGSKIVRNQLSRLNDPGFFKHIPSMRFEYFISLMQNALLIAGNSSAGIMEAPYLGIPSVNIGTRQRGRFIESEIQSVLNTPAESKTILEAITQACNISVAPMKTFGDGKSAQKFNETLMLESFWDHPLEKLDSNH